MRCGLGAWSPEVCSADLHLVGRDDAARRADVDAFAEAAAMILAARIGRKRQVGVDAPEKEERPRLAGNQHGVLASPAQPRLARELDLHHRCRVGEHAVAVRADFLRDPLGEPLQAPPEHLVIVAPERVARDEGLVAVLEHAHAVRRVGPIVHARGDDAQGARDERRGARPFDAVLSHIIELARETGCEPRAKARLGFGKVGVGDADRLEAQVPPPGLDLRGERLELRRAQAPHPPGRFRMTHPPDHSHPPARSQWGTHLEDALATTQLGSRLAGCVEQGMRLYFRGELGSGKSTLIRGLLRGLGVQTRVKSPTYALVELYVISRLNLYHFDFYRFLDAREFEDAGLADYFQGDGVCLVEWPERAGDALPPPDLELSLAYLGTGREISVKAHTAAGERCLAKSQDI